MNRVINKANKKLSLSNAALLLIGATLLAQLLGFFRLRLVAANFSPASTDAYFAAFQIPDFFYLTIAAGVLGVAFMPVLAERLHANDRKAIWDITSSLLNLMTIVMLAAAVFIFIFAEPLVHHIVGPGLDQTQLHQATTIMRIVAINPLLFTLSGILTSAQQTFGRFFFFAVAPLMYNLSIISSIYIFKYHLGVVGLGIGALVGASLQLLVASFGLWGLKFKWKPRIKLSSDFKFIMRKLPARAIDQGVDSINSIVETNRATVLKTGAVTSYNLASTIMNVPVMLFGTTIATAAFPRLNDRLAQGRNDLFHKEFFKVVETMVWIAMPITVVTFFTRGYLARLIFAKANPDVAVILGFLSVAIFARTMYTIISRYFYAKKDTSTPLFVSLFVIALNIILVFSFAKPGEYGIAGLAIAQSIAAATEIVILLLVIFIRDPYIFNAAFWGAILKIFSVTGFSVMTAFIMVSIFPLKIADKGIVTLGIKFAFIAGPTLLVHLFVSYLFGLDESRIVFKKVRQLILKPLQIQ